MLGALALGALSLSLSCGGGAATGGGAGPSSPSRGDAAPIAAPPAASLRPVAPTRLAAELEALGLDARKLPRLDGLEPDALRGVMKLFAQSLGVACSACHRDDDFRAPTEAKALAAAMWNDWTRGLSMASGEPLFCDSCHHGSATILDRGDARAVAAWMNDELVGRLRRVDAAPHGCPTCHGEPFDRRVLRRMSARH